MYTVKQVVKNLEKGEQKMERMTLVVHNGVFHTDDVMCGALVKIIYGDVNIIRAKRGEESLYVNDKNTVVADFGGGKFDHHEKAEKREKRENNIEYAAFGKLFREYYSLIGFNEKFYQKIDSEFISLLDNVDNNGPQAPAQALNMLINALNNKNIFTEEQDKAFENTVKIFTPILKAYFDKMLEQQKLDNIVKEIKNEKFHEFNEFFPTELLKETAIQFILFPGQNEYVVKSVDSIKYPIDIADNAKFVHAMKFIAKFEKKEDAIKCIQNNLK